MATHGFEALIGIPGDDAGGSLALVVRGEPSARLGSALQHGIDTLCVVPDDGSTRPIREVLPGGIREAGPDALVAAAAALRGQVGSAAGSAQPLPGGGYAVEIPAIGGVLNLTPGPVGAALALDPEFIADTGRVPLLVPFTPGVVVVPVEDRECVEEARPTPEVLRRIAPGHAAPGLVVLLVTGPRGTPLPDPLPITVFRGGDWPRPLAASVAAAAALAALEGMSPGTQRRQVLFTPAHDAGGPGALPTMAIERTATGAVRVTTPARRLF